MAKKPYEVHLDDDNEDWLKKKEKEKKKGKDKKPSKKTKKAMVDEVLSRFVEAKAKKPGLPRRPKYSEDLYVEYDEDTASWCVFGEKSGFAYASMTSKEQAKDWLKKTYPSGKTS